MPTTSGSKCLDIDCCGGHGDWDEQVERLAKKGWARAALAVSRFVGSRAKSPLKRLINL